MFLNVSYINILRDKELLEGMFQLVGIRYSLSAQALTLKCVEGESIFVPCTLEEYETKYLPRVRQALINKVPVLNCEGTCVVCYDHNEDSGNNNNVGLVKQFVKENESIFEKEYSFIWAD